MINKETIRKWWNIFVGDGGFTEIRILGKFQYSGYFRSVDNLIEQLAPYTELEDEQVYFVMNRIDDACYGRQQCEKFVKSPKVTTSDGNITHRDWVLIDYDPVRPAGTNATDAEFELAHRKAQAVYAFLKEQGFHDPVICKSGNGWHTLYRCDMGNTDADRDLVQRFLQSIAMMFTDDKVDIDEAVFNAARICKLYGTTAKKGANLPERPWRMSEIIYVPDEIGVNNIDLFHKVTDMMEKDEPAINMSYRAGGTSEPLNLESFLREHGIEFKVEQCSKWTKYVLDHCFFNPEHKGKDAAIIQMPSGAIKYTCLHNSCQHHTWQEMRKALDPSAYERKERTAQPLPVQREYAPMPQRPKYEIKDVVPELGEKWLSMSSIKKIDISALEHYKTGFTELDRHILGLFMGEVTLLSGSNSSGKTSWLNSLILNLIDQGAPTALWSGELPAPILKSWISMVAAGKRNLSPSQYNDGKFFVPNNVSERIDQWLDGRLFLYNNDYGNNWKQLFHDMELLLKCGVKFFVLDNLFSMNIDLLGTDNNSRQKELILQIKEFAKKNQVHIILVAHPRKVMTFLRKNDISGTSDLGNAVDDIFIIHRVNNDFFRAGADFFGKTEINRFQGFGNVIEVAKNRMFGAVDLMVGMHYEIESRRFKNAEYEDKQYGWERMGYEQTSIETPTPDVSYHEPRHETAVFKEDAPIDTGVPFAPPAMDDEPPF